MNISTLSLVALIAACAATSIVSAQVADVVFGAHRRRVRGNADDARRQQHRARQMRKLVDAMSVDPDPIVTTPAPVPVMPEPMTPAPVKPDPIVTPGPTPEPTPEPTPKPTDDTCDEQRASSSYRLRLGKDDDELRAKFLYDGNCEDVNGNPFSYGLLKDDVNDFDDCSDKCLETGAIDLVGIDYTCAGKDQFECHCLFRSVADTRSTTIVDSKDFDEIVEKDGFGYPTKKEVALRVRKEDDEVLCGTFEVDFGMGIGFAVEA